MKATVCLAYSNEAARDILSLLRQLKTHKVKVFTHTRDRGELIGIRNGYLTAVAAYLQTLKVMDDEEAWRRAVLRTEDLDIVRWGD